MVFRGRLQLLFLYHFVRLKMIFHISYIRLHVSHTFSKGFLVLGELHGNAECLHNVYQCLHNRKRKPIMVHRNAYLLLQDVFMWLCNICQFGYHFIWLVCLWFAKSSVDDIKPPIMICFACLLISSCIAKLWFSAF